MPTTTAPTPSPFGHTTNKPVHTTAATEHEGFLPLTPKISGSSINLFSSGAWGIFVYCTAGSMVTSVQLPLGVVPAFLAAGGQFDSVWRVLVACRDGRVYTVKASIS